MSTLPLILKSFTKVTISSYAPILLKDNSFATLTELETETSKASTRLFVDTSCVISINCLSVFFLLKLLLVRVSILNLRCEDTSEYITIDVSIGERNLVLKFSTFIVFVIDTSRIKLTYSLLLLF